MSRVFILSLRNTNANGQRFIVSADGQISMSEIMEVLKNKKPDVVKRISSMIVGSFDDRVANLLEFFYQINI